MVRWAELMTSILSLVNACPLRGRGPSFMLDAPPHYAAAFRKVRSTPTGRRVFPPILLPVGISYLPE